MYVVRQGDWEADILDDVDRLGGIVVLDEVECHTMTFENAEDAFRVSRPSVPCALHDCYHAGWLGTDINSFLHEYGYVFNAKPD